MSTPNKFESEGSILGKVIRGSLVSVLILLTVGCGKSPAPEEMVGEPATPPSETPIPEPTPTAVATPSSPSHPEKVFVVTAFQAVSEIGTHDFPAGTEVNVLKEEGEDYLVERDGVGVQISKTYFSESNPIETPAAPTPSPTVETEPEPITEEETEDIIGMGEPPAPLENEPTAPEVDPAPLEEDTITEEVTEDPRIEEITQSLREINDQIRSTQGGVGQQDSSTSPSELESLKKKRDQLGEELTTYGKP